MSEEPTYLGGPRENGWTAEKARGAPGVRYSGDRETAPETDPAQRDLQWLGNRVVATQERGPAKPRWSCSLLGGTMVCEVHWFDPLRGSPGTAIASVTFDGRSWHRSDPDPQVALDKATRDAEAWARPFLRGLMLLSGVVAPFCDPEQACTGQELQLQR